MADLAAVFGARLTVCTAVYTALVRGILVLLTSSTGSIAFDETRLARFALKLRSIAAGGDTLASKSAV